MQLTFVTMQGFFEPFQIRKIVFFFKEDRFSVVATLNNMTRHTFEKESWFAGMLLPSYVFVKQPT